MSPPHRLARVEFRLRIRNIAVERTIERRQHAALEIIEQWRIAVPWPTQILHAKQLHKSVNATGAWDFKRRLQGLLGNIFYLNRLGHAPTKNWGD
jgi:hypothetical protein